MLNEKWFKYKHLMSVRAPLEFVCVLKRTADVMFYFLTSFFRIFVFRRILFSNFFKADAEKVFTCIIADISSGQQVQKQQQSKQRARKLLMQFVFLCDDNVDSWLDQALITWSDLLSPIRCCTYTRHKYTHKNNSSIYTYYDQKFNFLKYEKLKFTNNKCDKNTQFIW